MLAGLRRRLAENRVLMWVCLVIAVNQLGFGIIVPVIPIYARTFGVSEAAIGLVVAIYGLGRFLFSVPVGQAADRYGRKPVIVPSCLLGAAAFAGFAYALDYRTFVLSAVLWGVSSALGGSSAAYAADQAPPGGNGVTMGIYRMLSDAGYVLGPALLGLIAQEAGGQTALLAAAAIAIATMVPFALLAPETGPRARAAPKTAV